MKCSNKTVWALRRKSFKSNLKTHFSFNAVAVVGAINVKGEQTALYIFDSSIYGEKFQYFHERLRRHWRSERITVMLDNLPMHYSESYCKLFKNKHRPN